MTSEQVLMLIATALLSSGCSLLGIGGADPLQSPYPTRRVWAIAPLRNESGSVQANGLILADHLARQLENASNLDVLAVNRVLAAMESLRMSQVNTPDQAKQLLRTLGADGLVVGTITAYDPYDPPKLGLAVELYLNDQIDQLDSLDVRQLAQRSTDPAAPATPQGSRFQPVSTVSTVMDAAAPEVRRRLQRYASNRGQKSSAQSWNLYRINIDLFSEFVSYVVSWRLLQAEKTRLAPQDRTSAVSS